MALDTGDIPHAEASFQSSSALHDDWNWVVKPGAGSDLPVHNDADLLQELLMQGLIEREGVFVEKEEQKKKDDTVEELLAGDVPLLT